MQRRLPPSSGRWQTPLLALCLGIGMIPSATGTLCAQSDSSGVWEVLKKHDKDGDGKITPDEYSRGEERFRRLDRDGDGFLTEEDARGGRGMRRRGGGDGEGMRGRRGSGSGRGGYAARMFFGAVARNGETDGGKADVGLTAARWKEFSKTIETDEDGVVHVEGLMEKLSSATGNRGRRGGGRMFRMLDHDGNGTLEISDLDSHFKSLDSDGDGALSSGELNSGRGGAGRRGPRGPEGDGDASPGSGRTGPGREGSRGRGGDRDDGPGAQSAPKAGDPAPDFTLPYANDTKKNVQLSSFAGTRPVALIFGSYT